MVLVVLLSLVCFCGAVQVYNRQYAKAVVIFIASIGFALITGGLAMICIWPILILDGILVGSKLNQGMAVGHWDFF